MYGELIETLHAGREAELAPLPEAWRLQTVLLKHLDTIWRKPDHGLWEMRGEPRVFTHSRLMCWVAFDRMIGSAEHFGLAGPTDHWRQVRDTIHADICEHGFDARRKTFVQHYGGTALDASLLLIPQVGFLPPDDPRVVGTIEAIEQEFLDSGFVRRYSTDDVDDGVSGGEGAFLACSFWLADAYVMCGRFEDAARLFDHLLTVRNDLGLLAEEYDPLRKRLVGNFPQGFSHIGLINTAYNHPGARPGPPARGARGAGRGWPGMIVVFPRLGRIRGRHDQIPIAE